MYSRCTKLFMSFCLLLGMWCVYSGDLNVFCQTIYDRKLEIVQPDDEAFTIVGTVTLCRAGMILSQVYQKPVTCEGPTDVLQWDDDVDQETVAGGRIMRIPKRVTFVIPDEVKPDKNQGLDSRFEQLKEFGEYQKDIRDTIEFEWGAKSVVAREALIDLLEKANTTLSWRVDCTDHPNIDQKCFIEIYPLNATYLLPDGKKFETNLFYDRVNINK